MKRRKTNLGGGTGDINPQFIHGKVVQSGVDTCTSVAFILPVARFGSTANKSVVIEVLKVFAELTLFPTETAAQLRATMSWYMSTKFHGTTDVLADEADVFAWNMETYSGAFTAAGSYAQHDDKVSCMDLTDGNGHGVLIATDSFSVQLQSALTGTTNQLRFKILYRFKAVPLAEYIGIVQSQQ